MPWLLSKTSSLLGSTQNSVETFKVLNRWKRVLNTYQNLENYFGINFPKVSNFGKV